MSHPFALGLETRQYCVIIICNQECGCGGSGGDNWSYKTCKAPAVMCLLMPSTWFMVVASGNMVNTVCSQPWNNSEPTVGFLFHDKLDEVEGLSNDDNDYYYCFKPQYQ